MNYTLTPSIEDYLETILMLSEKNDSVRVTDIAKKLKVAKASVTQSLSTMQNLQLVKREKYGPITLTAKGKYEALQVISKHWLITRFMIHVLKIDHSIATKDACRMEHVISPETVEAMINFLSTNNYQLDGRFDLMEVKELLSKRKLSQLLPGQKGKVDEIIASGLLRRRILEMGIIKGDVIEVKRIAPLGDPIEIFVKDYNLSIRKEEAAMIIMDLI